MKQILSAFALALAFTSIALGQAPQKHEMTDSKKGSVLKLRC